MEAGRFMHKRTRSLVRGKGKLSPSGATSNTPITFPCHKTLLLQESCNCW